MSYSKRELDRNFSLIFWNISFTVFFGVLTATAPLMPNWMLHSVLPFWIAISVWVLGYPVIFYIYRRKP